MKNLKYLLMAFSFILTLNANAMQLDTCHFSQDARNYEIHPQNIKSFTKGFPAWSK